MPDTVGLEHQEPTSLRGIAKRAQACKDHRFQDLYRLLDAGLLLACWGDLNKSAASGVDRVTAQAYEQDLIANIQDLAERLRGRGQAFFLCRILITRPIRKNRVREQLFLIWLIAKAE